MKIPQIQKENMRVVWASGGSRLKPQNCRFKAF